MERRGLSPSRFQNKVDPQFLCPACQRVARGCVVCSQCSAVFCSLCLTRQKCTACGSTRFEPLSGVALKMYNGLQYVCKCGKSLVLGEFDRHEVSCRSGGDEVSRLNRIVADLTSENTALKRENQALKDELAALKGKAPAVARQEVTPTGAKPEPQPQPKKRTEAPSRAHVTPPPKSSNPSSQEESKNPPVIPTPQGEKRPAVVPLPAEKRPVVAQVVEKRPAEKKAMPAQQQERKPPVEVEEKKAVPVATLNQAAMTIQRAFRMKKARELRAALQEKRAERMQHTGFKKKRNEAQEAFKNIQQVVQNLNIPTPKAAMPGKPGARAGKK